MLSLGRLEDKGNRTRRVPQSKTEILTSSERYVATRETSSLVVARKEKKKKPCHRAWTELVCRRDPPLPERIERLELLKATARVGTGERKAGNTYESAARVYAGSFVNIKNSKINDQKLSIYYYQFL